MNNYELFLRDEGGEITNSLHYYGRTEKVYDIKSKLASFFSQKQ